MIVGSLIIISEDILIPKHQHSLNWFI